MNISIKIDKPKFNEIEERLEETGFRHEAVKTQYEEWRMRSSEATAILYSSGKLLVQGKELSRVQKLLGLNGDTESGVGVPRVGSDEVGKGDYFGPLVLCSFYVDSVTEHELLNLGIKDSKKLSDTKILEMFNEFESRALYRSLVIQPKDYNKLVDKFKNVAVILAKSHTALVEGLLEELVQKRLPCEKVVIDQFSTLDSRLRNELGPLAKRIKFEQFHKGESDLAVAAASVFARAIFLNEWSAMEERYSFTFPKGASNVIEAGKEFVRVHGSARLNEVAKISFKTTKSIL